MDIITLTPENLAKEHICCAISNNNDPQVAAKKAWLAARMEEGLVFKKADARGKCFIEYIPAEHAWAPITAPGYMYIDCFWVSGQLKGHGYADMLLAACIEDSRAKGKEGLTVLSSKKKQGFLSDPAYLTHKGFLIADTALPAYELRYLPFTDGAVPPRFNPQAKTPHTDGHGFELYYTAQCPYTARYVPVIAAAAADMGLELAVHEIKSAAEAQAAPAPFTTYGLFYEGHLITHEILSEPKFRKLAEQCICG